MYIDRPPLAISSAGNAERLAKTSYRKLIPKVLGPSSIVSFQPNTPSIDERGIHTTVSIEHATLLSSKELPTNASQRIPVQEDLPTDFSANQKKLKLNLLSTLSNE